MNDTAYFVETFADTRNLAPGVYVSSASHEAYGALEAFVAEGRAELLGERYAEDGEKLIAIEMHDYQPNVIGSIRIGREFFTSAIKDYEDWQEKWWREAIQNAVDAGADSIHCDAVQAPDGSYTISVEDNGGGMDEDVLINKFLVLGGTTKVAGAGTGGFGKAKELLVLPWLSWRIHSRDISVQGSGIDYSTESASYLSGTRLEVVMPADQTTHEAAALSFIGKCDLDAVFTVNGQRARANLKTGDSLRDFGGRAELYYDKREAPFRGNLLVRANGLYMFSRYVTSTVPGQVIIELRRPSIELLTANRDGFRDRSLQREVDDFLSELAADVMSALRKKSGRVRERFVGTGKFTADVQDDIRSAAYDALGSLEPVGKRTHGGRQYLSDEQITHVAATLRDALPSERTVETDEEARGASFVPSYELAEVLLRGVDLAGATQVENAIKQLAWEPDFYLINEVEGFKVPKKFYPATMTRNVRKLARFWAEICRFVLMQLGSGRAFGVGFQFDEYAVATYMEEDQQHWIMINPFHNVNPLSASAELYDLADWDHIMQLYASAIHECTHMADGISYHDESFAAAMTRNMARTMGKDKQIRAIKRIVTKAEA
jgi:hypothetical protein